MQYNVLITKGADFALTLQFSEGAPIRTSGAAIGAGTIPLSSELLSPLSTGDKVDFGGVLATLTAPAEIGDTSLSVAALPLTVSAGVGYKVTGLTGYTIAASLIPPTGDPIALTVTTPEPTEGSTTLSLTDTQTAALAATLPVGQFPSVAELQCREYTGIESELRVTLTNGDITTIPFGGLAFVGVVGGSLPGLSLSPGGQTATQQCHKVRLGFGYPSVVVRRLEDLEGFATANEGDAARYIGGEWVPAAGGAGGSVDSVNGQTGFVVLDAADVGADPAGTATAAIAAHVALPDPHTQYAATADLGTAAFTASTAYATAAQGGLADSAVQPGDLAAIATTGSYDDLTGLPTNLTDVAALMPENGKVLGWAAGSITNLTLGGGGDMLKSVYDINDNGIVDEAESVPWSGVTTTPTTLAGYGITDAEPLGAAAAEVAAHVAELDPHTQYAETADLGTAAFTDSTAYAIAAQGALADTALQPGAIIPAADVSVDNTGLIVLSATDGQTAIEQIDDALLLARSTGIEFGGEITINAGNPQRIDIAAGQGQILDDTDPLNETYTPISWAAITAQTITNTGITWFYFDDNSGNVKQTQTAPTVENRRLWIVLGRVTVAADLSIAGIAQDRDWVQQLAVQLREVADAVGLLKLSGLVVTANGANLLLDLSAGKLFDFGSNGRLSPHSKDFTTNSGFTFQYVKRTTDPALQVNRTTVDPNNYDLNNVITAVTTNRYTIQDIYLFPSGNIRLQYGQAQYNSLSDAVVAISNRTFVKNPNLDLGLRLGFLVVQQGTTALNNASQSTIINANKFGDVGGGVTAAAAGALLASNNLSDLADVSAARTNLGLAIGTNVQAFDADLSSWAGVTRASGFDTFAATPSSANLAALVTGETGSGALVFATSPTLVTPVLGVASGTSLLLSSGTGLQVGSSIPFSDAAGTLTLQNVDALDATTEATIEAAIDTLPNLTSIQARSFTFGAYGPTLLNTSSEANFKATVNLEPGVDVQAFDAELAAIAGLTSAADRLPYFTGLGTAALATFTTFARTLIDDADAAAARTTLGLATSVVEIKSVFKTDTQASAAVAAGAVVDVSGLTISHAVAESTNTVLLLCSLGMVTSSILAGNVGLILYAGATALQIGAVAGTRSRVNSAYRGSASVDSAGFPLFAIATHSPGSTSSISYNAKILNIAPDAHTLYVNRTPADEDQVARPRTVSSLVLVELRP